MCWNKEISLSTFVLATAAITIGLITQQHDANYAIFYFTIASMQLLEFFIWNNGLRNPQLNKMLSMIGLAIIFAQPLAAGLMIHDQNKKLVYYLAYAIWMLVYIAMTYGGIVFKTSIASNGHLRWHWLEPPTDWLILTWTIFVCAAVWMWDTSRFDATLVILFIIALTGWSYYSYRQYGGAWGSVYCSFINVMFVIIIAKAMVSQYCT
jgi:hypothetical protein